ncbi:MAG: hypothetical protein Terrestrivirus1_316 [Terrestrivirus sp.]|uniref:Uncharacterized protein n=1 Tax=Terrestrivirus sp. TaxID=2487775 RepID=A0A3G4ZKS8_9VIRU|nr:MAG: hypothetical protein Terrestrivirus1_316 [Terrestrivirus sp.]
MVRYVNIINNNKQLVLDDDDYNNLQSLEDKNIYYLGNSLKVKVNNKYKNFEVEILGLEIFHRFCFIGDRMWDYRRKNLVMESLRQGAFDSGKFWRDWNDLTKEWEYRKY